MRTAAAAVPRGVWSLLTLLLLLAFVQWARALLIPLALGLVLSFTLNPLVRRLQRLGLPRSAGALCALALVWCLAGLLVWLLQDDVAAIAAAAPGAVRRVVDGLEGLRRDSAEVWESVRMALTAIEHMLSLQTGAAGRAAPGLRVEAPLVRWSDFLWTGSVSVVALVAQSSVVSFLVFFLLASGATFKRKLMRLVGGDLSRKKAAVRMIDRIGTRIQSSLLVLACTNLLVGLATGLAFWLMGLHNILVWIVATATLHFVPYFGAGLLAVAAAVVSWLQFDSWLMAGIAAFVSLAIATIVGTFLTTGLQARVSRIDPAAVFIGLLVWAWLWGVWGFLLGMPLIAIFKVVCDHVASLAPLGQFLEAPRQTPRARAFCAAWQRRAP